MINNTYTPWRNVWNRNIPDDPAYYTTYGQLGSSYAPLNFFSREPGEPVEFDTTFGSPVSNINMPEYETASLGPSLTDVIGGAGIGAAATYLGGKAAETPGFFEGLINAPGKAWDDAANLINPPAYSPVPPAPTYSTLPLAPPGTSPATGKVGPAAAPSGNVTTGGYTTAPLWEPGTDWAGNLTGGGIQSGVFGGGLRFGLGMLSGEDTGTAAKRAGDVGLATAFGYTIGGDVGGAVGSFIGNLFNRVICTELNAQGLLSDTELRAEELYTLRKIHPLTIRGYHIWAVPYVKIMQRSSLLSAFTNWWAGARAKEILYQCGKRENPHYGGKLARVIVEPVCFGIGCLAWAFNIPKLECRNA